MKYALISDIHANLDALEQVLKDARAHGAEQIVCLGDVVGYGPRPAETLARVREACAVVLAGNHDDAVSERADSSAFIDLAADAVQRHREALAPDARAWLKTLPYTAGIDGAVCTHGDLCDPPRFYYISDENDAAANFGATDAQLVFAGHTHVPGIFLVGRSGTVYRTEPQDFILESGKRYIVNPGSVGYPRETDGQCYSSYVLYDTDERSVAFRFLPFSVASVMQRGQTPRRLRARTLAALLAAVAAVAALVAFALAPRVEVAEDPALLVDTRTLPLEPDLRHVRANLELAKGSVPVVLRVAFLGRDDAPLATESLTVKKSCGKEIKVPAGAVQAVFDAVKVSAADEPVLQAFRPTASTR